MRALESDVDLFMILNKNNYVHASLFVGKVTAF